MREKEKKKVGLLNKLSADGNVPDIEQFKTHKEFKLFVCKGVRVKVSILVKLIEASSFNFRKAQQN